jgi:hypothetical protein
MKTMEHIFKPISKFLCGFLLLSASTVAYSQQDSIRILFVGNSYTHMNNMPKIFEKIALTAGQRVIVEKSAKSGASFKEHASRADLFAAIKSKKWDYVILQGFSRELSYSIETIDTATVPYVRQIRDSILANNSCAQILFYMTWGYESGYQELEETNTFDKMADSIARGYQYLGRIFDCPVVPVGMIWKQVKSNTTIDLYAEDRAHPSKNGSFLIASTFYNAIFDTPLDRVFTGTVETEVAKPIREIMQQFMLDNRNSFGLDRNQFQVLNVSTADKLQVSYLSNFPNASKVIWDFGDGQTTNASGGVYFYQKPGKYEIILTVVYPCGAKNTFRKWIEIK